MLAVWKGEDVKGDTKEEENSVTPNNFSWAGQFGSGTACLCLDSLYFPKVCPRRRGFSGTEGARACPYLNSRDRINSDTALM